MLLDKIILDCQLQVGQERTINSVYHILQGKPSIQTIQDIHLYKLAAYYGIHKKLLKTDYHIIIERLVAKQYLLQVPQTESYVVTEIGEQFTLNSAEQLSFSGYQFKQIDDIFLQRLLLLIQVWTNSNQQHFKFIPIVENYQVEQWVKQYYAKTKDTVATNLDTLYKELTTILIHIKEEYAAIFVDQLTGYHHIGLMNEQLSNIYGYSVNDIALINRHVVHKLIEKSLEDSKQFTIITALLDNLLVEVKVTESTKQTLHLLNQGKQLEQIAQIRRLKINTVYDHIVEIALFDDSFPISNYVPKSYKVEIINAIKELASFRIKAIKEVVNPKITYFQIRLILTGIK